MSVVLHLYRRLDSPPQLGAPQGVRIRTYADPSDIERWLEVRRLAFARERVGVREWTIEDFHAEFLTKPWWRPDWLWLAEPDDDRDARATPTIGAVALAMRGTNRAALPVIHWLAVAPAWRRCGVASALVANLEAAAWREGFREVHLETHTAWNSALRFYESLGYSSDS